MRRRLFAGLADSAPDPILTVMERFRSDPRPEKVDLGVGIYRDAAGRTPVMAAVKAAERRLWETQDSKAYTGLAGDPAFLRAFAGLALGRDTDWTRGALIATPGGTGALRQGLELVRQARPDACIWLPRPSWHNHAAIAGALGCPRAEYAYAAPGADGVDGARTLADLERGAPGDVVVLHGSCHNPTGLDPEPALWDEIALLCRRRGVVPFVDMAYQGLGAGLAEDAAGLRRLATDLPEVMVALSASKTFGLYRERVGLLAVLTDGAGTAGRVQAALNALNRLTYTFPPDHGARVVQTILDDARLRAEWQDELAAMRARLTELRHGLADRLAARGAGGAAGIRAGRGLFVRLALDTASIDRLEAQHALYVVPDGRINVAGLDQENLPRVAELLSCALEQRSPGAGPGLLQG